MAKKAVGIAHILVREAYEHRQSAELVELTTSYIDPDDEHIIEAIDDEMEVTIGGLSVVCWTEDLMAFFRSGDRYRFTIEHVEDIPRPREGQREKLAQTAMTIKEQGAVSPLELRDLAEFVLKTLEGT